MNEELERLEFELLEIWKTSPHGIEPCIKAMARYCKRREIEARLEEIYKIYPEFRNEIGGITIQVGSSKHFALKRKVILENLLKDLDKGAQPND